MRLLLDENLPKRLKLDFPEYEVFTIRDMGWNGIKIGELLKRMLADNFDALLTFDKNLQYQQNSKNTPLLFLYFQLVSILMKCFQNYRLRLMQRLK